MLSMRGWRIGRALGVLVGTLLVGALVLLTGGAVARAQSQPGNSASVTPDPGGQTQGSTFYIPASADGRWGVTVKWNAGCPNTSPSDAPGDYWWVAVDIKGGGGGPGYSDTAYGPGPPFSAPPATNQSQFGLAMKTDAAGKPSPREQTFTWTATLQCGGYETIGSGSFQFVSGIPCDPGAYSKAQREYQTAESLVESGSKNLEEAIESDGKIDQEARDEAAKIAIDGVGLSQLLVALEHGAVITPQSASLVESVHAIVELIGVAEQAELKGQGWDRLTSGAKADFELAQRLVADANQVLNQAFANGCRDPIHGQVKKLLDDQKRDDLARQIINSWTHNLDETQYVNPVTQETESVDLALKQVKAELSAGHQQPNIAARHARASRSASITVAQIHAAIHYLANARGLDLTLKAHLGRIKSADETVLERLRAVFG
jgi:hypothetical protein